MFDLMTTMIDFSYSNKEDTGVEQLAVDAWWMYREYPTNPFMSGEHPLMYVCIYNAFENIFRIKHKFEKYLKEVCLQVSA